MIDSAPSARAIEIEKQFRAMAKPAAFDLMQERANTKDAHVLTGVPSGVMQEWETVAGVRCLRVRPNSERSDLEVIFVHGGAYCLMSAMTHHRLAGHIANAIGAAVLLPDYRLAPEYAYPIARDESLGVIADRRQNGPRYQIVMGDSAGGGLSLSAVCALRDTNAKLPDALVLMSPWLDLTLSGEAVQSGSSDDPILTVRNLEACAALYCGKMKPEDPAISPLFAALDHLPPMLVQSSEKDLVRDDATRLAERWPQDDPLVLQSFPRMLHSFQMFAGDMPEADMALQQVAEFVHKTIEGGSG